MNASYVDSFFCFLNILLDNYGCINCIGYTVRIWVFRTSIRYRLRTIWSIYTTLIFQREYKRPVFIENGDCDESDGCNAGFAKP
jgi:hypothetical protein